MSADLTTGPGLAILPQRLIRYRAWRKARRSGPFMFVGVFASLVSSGGALGTCLPAILETSVLACAWYVLQTFCVFAIVSGLLGAAVWIGTERSYRDLREA